MWKAFRSISKTSALGFALVNAGLGAHLAVAGNDELSGDTAVKKAIEDGNVSKAMQEIRKLPLERRMEWIEPLAQLRLKKIPLSTSTSSSESGAASGQGVSVVPGFDTKGGSELPKGGMAGGGVVADFQSLITLIQGVVDGNWDIDGGTDTIQPFASGVWIDAEGIVQPKKGKKIPSFATPKETAEPLAIPGSEAWQVPSNLRWISLNRLQEKLKERAEEGRYATASMELLGGLARIEYVAWDPTLKEWMLGGPAGNFALNPNGELVHQDLKLPPVLLEDLLSIAPHVLGRKGVMGCSIDPVESRLASVQQFLSDKSAIKMLSQTPKKWTEQLTEKMGPQKVTIMGLPKDSPTGLALLVADQHMKRLGFGMESAPKGFMDYIRIADQVNAVPNQGLVRWWFALQPDSIETDESGHLFVLPRHSVQVMSEKEWMDAAGKRTASATRDEAADAFAKSFTSRFDEIQAMYPMYGRLRHIFDLTIAMEIIRKESLHHPERSLAELAQTKIQPHMEQEPQQVPSLATYRKIANKSVVGIVSGGVVIESPNLKYQSSPTPGSLPRTNQLHPAYPEDEEVRWIFK